ncbi:hypothetical protein FS842_011047 [Serendipita sp. 407]|nr:hypothetical protein FS842_011047 [Serendipita sp. 407]
MIKLVRQSIVCVHPVQTIQELAYSSVVVVAVVAVVAVRRVKIPWNPNHETTRKRTGRPQVLYHTPRANEIYYRISGFYGWDRWPRLSLMRIEDSERLFAEEPCEPASWRAGID